MPFLFALEAQNLTISFPDFLASIRMRMENIPRTRPVTKGKNPEPGAVRVPTFSRIEPAQIARETARRKRPDTISYFRIVSRLPITRTYKDHMRRAKENAGLKIL